MKKISVITINRNNAAGLQKTINSVVSQASFDFEYVVVDGLSTDNSLAVIKDYEEKIDRWLSENDKGIYNAMNKGLAMATGEYVIFLNSGDVFHNDDVLNTVFAHMQGEDVIYGNIGVYENGKLREIASASTVEFYKRYQHNLPPHPALFAKRAVLLELGGFDETYRIIADVALIAKIFGSQARTYKHINSLFTIFDMEGVSSNNENQRNIYHERKAFIQKEFPQYLKDLEAVYNPGLLKKMLHKFNLKKV